MTSYNTLGIWYSSRADVDGRRIRPLRDTLTDSRGIRPSMDTSTYRHWDVGYGHYPQLHNVQGVQHHFIIPEQRRHVTLKNLELNVKKSSTTKPIKIKV